MKGHKFYGRFNPDIDEYGACVARTAEDHRPKTIGLQQWTIPKGFYTYEKIDEWNSKRHLSAPTFERMIKENNGHYRLVQANSRILQKHERTETTVPDRG